MPYNPKKPGRGLSTSFRSDEVEAICQLFEILNRGGDAKVLLRAESVRSVQQKFARMKAKMRRQAEEARMGENPQPVDELGSEE